MSKRENDQKAQKALKEKSMQKGGWKYKVYAVCFFLVFFVLPFSLSNFVDGGEDIVKACIPFVIGIIIALFINWLRWSKHITAVENTEAYHYMKRDSVEISYSYDKFTYTD